MPSRKYGLLLLLYQGSSIHPEKGFVWEKQTQHAGKIGLRRRKEVSAEIFPYVVGVVVGELLLCTL
jgi:hypothetical protein